MNLLPMAQAFPLSPRSPLYPGRKNLEEERSCRTPAASSQSLEQKDRPKGRKTFTTLAALAPPRDPAQPSKQPLLLPNFSLPPELHLILSHPDSGDRPTATTYLRKIKKSSDLRLVNQYKLTEKIEKSAVCTVYAAEAQGKLYYAKKYNKKKGVLESLVRKRSVSHLIETEVSAYLSVRHRSISRLHEVISCPVTSKVYLMTDRLSSGRLIDNTPMRENAAKSLFFQAFSAVFYLHSLGFSHRSLTLKSFLLDCSGFLQVSDLATMGKSGEAGEKTDWLYGSPEAARKGRCGGTTMEDIWAMGVAVYWTVVGKPPFSGNSPCENCESVRNCKVTGLEGTSEEFRSLVLRLLEKNPERRMTATEAMNHPWFHCRAP